MIVRMIARTDLQSEVLNVGELFLGQHSISPPLYLRQIGERGDDLFRVSCRWTSHFAKELNVRTKRESRCVVLHNYLLRRIECEDLRKMMFVVLRYKHEVVRRNIFHLVNFSAVGIFVCMLLVIMKYECSCSR